MGFIFEATIVEFALGAALLFWLFYKYVTSNYSYWENRSIAHEEPSFPFGTDKNLIFMIQHIGQFYESIYTKFKDEKVVGMIALNYPYLVIRDPDLLKLILTKDFHHFVDRGVIDPDVLKPVARHLVHMTGDSWKTMRHRLVPAFTSGKMKMMFCLMEACANELMKAIEPIAEQNGKIAVKDFIARFTTDVIASCAFGLEANSIQDPDNEFTTNRKQLSGSTEPFQLVKLRLASIFPWLVNKLHLFECFSFTSADFFLKIIGDTIAYREKNSVIRNDFVDLLIKMKNNTNFQDEEGNEIITDDKSAANGEAGITLEEMTAQAILFLFAGFETTSSAMSFCLYEISLNTDIQKKMRKEIDEVLAKHNGKLCYDALQDMTYMEAVINETLRRYSALPFLARQCTEEYKLPGLDLVIPKGMKVIIPLYGIHHDPQYYPDPYKFDPERFTGDQIKTKNNYTFMPFGEGPRMCLGNRFAMMQMKSCLSLLLHKYELTITEETPVTLVIDRKQLITVAESPIVLKISKHKG